MRLFGRLRKAVLGKSGRTGLRLVVYAGVCVAVLLYLISLIGNVHFFQDNHGYKAQLADVNGLHTNDAVKIAGVEVGKVTGIHLEHGHALVSFQVRSGVHLPKDTKVAIRWRNLLGQKYLYLYPPTSGPPLAPGSTLPLRDEIPTTEVGDFLNAVGPVLQAIDPHKANEFVESLNQALDGNNARVRDLLSNAAKISDTVGGLDTDVGAVIDNLHQVLGALADRNGDLVRTIDNLRNLSGTLADHNTTITTLLDEFTTLNHQVDALLQRNEGDFTKSITNLQTIVNTLAQHHQDLDVALGTLPQGLLGYFRISRYGQWFNSRVTIACMAGDSPAAHSNRCTRNDEFSSKVPSRGSSASSANMQGLISTITGGTS